MSLSPENHDGVFWLLGSLIVLTLSGVLLSILVDKKFSFSQEKNSIHETISADLNRITDLRFRIDQCEKKLATAAFRAETAKKSLSSITTTIPEVEDEIDLLLAKKLQLTNAIPKTLAEFETYSEAYKAHTWKKAVGERIDHLFLKTGRQYDRVIITRVTETGLEISHAHGRARVDSTDLSNALQDRFQWVETEVSTKQDSELAPRRSEVALQRPQNSISPTIAEKPRVNPDAETLNQARTLVTTGRAAVASLRNLHAEAVSNSSYGNQRSVPGSLRTWPEQAAILEEKLIKATAKLSLVTGQLREISPSDPLLQVP